MAANLIQVYFAKRLLSSVALVATISVTLFLVVSLILWSPSMIEHGWNEHDIFLKIAYLIPWFLGNIYPAVIGVGTLITFSSLAQNNEIVILQTCGLSKIDFIKIILVPGIILALFGFFLISFLGQMGYDLSEKMDRKHISFHSAWLKEKNNIIHVKKMSGNQLYGIDIFNLTNSGVKKFYTAKDAVTGNSSTLYSVLVKHYKNSAVTQKHIQELVWSGLFPKEKFLNLLQVSQRRLNLFQLYKVINIQKKMGLNFKNYQFRFWRMILLPFFSLMLMFIMIPFAFQEKRSKSLVNSAVFGLVISIIFYFFNQISWSLMVILNLPIFLGALIAPVIIFIFCSLYLRCCTHS